MGACAQIPGLPPLVEIQLPVGRLGSMASGTQQVANSMDPFQSLIEAVQPALAAVSPVFDIIGLVTAGLELLLLIAQVIGSVMGFLVPGNPFSLLFSLPDQTDENGNPIPFAGIGPPLPDFAAVGPLLVDAVQKLLCFGIKLVMLMPQFSGVATVKDTLLTAMAFADAAMSQVNSLSDKLADIPPPDTGNPVFDHLLQCAIDNADRQLEHKLGPVANLVPLMAVVSQLADLVKQPIPGVIVDVVKLLAERPPDGLGIIPFPDLTAIGGKSSDEQRRELIELLEEMAISGLPIEIPDFSDLSSLGDTLNDIQEQLEPMLDVFELVQKIVDKLTKC